MANVKISNLPAAVAPTDPTDVVPIVQGGVTKKAQVSDFGFLQSGTGAVTRTVQSKLRDVVSVKDFGAVGDGVTDDRAAIVLALTAAKGKGLYFPAGTYLISSGITLNNTYTDMLIYGDGYGSVLKLGASATSPIVRISGGLRLFFSNLKFDGNSSAQSSGANHCVRLDSAASNIYFENVWFYDSYDDNVVCLYTSGIGAVNTVNFTNCRFEKTLAAGNGNLLLWNTENITVQGCYFTDWTYSSIAVNYFSPAVLGGLVVDSCYFQNTNSDLFAIEFVAGDDVTPNDNVFRIKNVVISNNIFDANNKATLGASGISGWADYVSITGNTWRRSDSGTWRQGIEAAGNYWTISGNVLDDGRIVCSTTGTASSGQNYVVTNNSVRVNGGSEKYGLQFGGTGTFQNLIVSNNSVALFGLTGPNSGAINLGTYSGNAVIKQAVCANNVLSHDSVVPAVVGIRFEPASGSENISVYNNTIINASTGIGALSAIMTDVDINGNDLRNCTTNINIPASGIVRVYDNTFSGSYQLVSADRGDASVTVINGVDAPTQIFDTPLTANRTITLSSTNAFAGATFTVVRTAAATGAFTLDFGGLKNLDAGESCVVQYNGTAWFLISFTAL